jgi:hypothetical protein
MRKLVWAASAALIVSAPASAVGLEDLAKVVLGGKSVLKKADEKCPKNSFALTKNDELAMTLAVAAVEQALPVSQFQALDKKATDDASTASNDTQFCAETKKKKSGLMSKIKKAGKSILKGGIL